MPLKAVFGEVCYVNGDVNALNAEFKKGKQCHQGNGVPLASTQNHNPSLKQAYYCALTA